MPRLHHLNLSHNNLEAFDNETFNKNEELLSLDISHNLFSEFDEFTFKGLEVLEVVALSYQSSPPNYIDKYCKLPLVQVLNVSHNAIAFIEGKLFTHFANLKFLDLSHNRISFVPAKTFGSMSMLLSIKLNNNTLLSMDDAVLSELKLSHLDLSCNRLSSDNFLWPSAGIKYLNLTFNAYKEVNASVLQDVETDLWGTLQSPFARLTFHSIEFSLCAQAILSTASGL